MFHLPEVLDCVAAAIPDREAIVCRSKRWTFANFQERSSRLANALLALGLGCHQERPQLENWQSGQDRLAIYLYNGNEYLESMFGAFKARLAPFNVNYRYVEEELIYLLNNSEARVIVYQRSFGEKLAAIRDQLPALQHYIEVDDGGPRFIEDAVDYEDLLREAEAKTPTLHCSPDDLYILYTGGTTGKPKGVLWRQGDIMISVLGGRRLSDKGIIDSLEEIAATALKGTMPVMPAPPFMHAAGQWNAIMGLFAGNTVVIQDRVDQLDPADVLDTIDREKVVMISIVGDAFALPLIKEMKKGKYTLASLRFFLNSGAHLSVKTKHELVRLLPKTRILDFLGSSEGGNQGQHVDDVEGNAPGTFCLSPGNAVLNDTKTGLLEPGHVGVGWWARQGYVPIGYLNDEVATKKTFVELAGERYAIAGDRAQLLAGDIVRLLGRDSLVINSGGEKVFVEEVEEALKKHAAVTDALVVGRESTRWGHEVVAVIACHDGQNPGIEELKAECARHIARYKLPKAVFLVPEIPRHANGKPDYKWAENYVRSQSVREDG
ncbi:MAG: acyl-CoA synthetase [Sneathiella sp.]|uniref:AMP-binding protein n=1 Tax=Sneathiella sp. TaxID=1964365 RepID=UPI000C49C1B8|nr:AMP-binding protein [Sneathiella sp.]MAZ03273.1 acyl-CoA synthetase [Sneathiella sp.]